MDPPPVSVLVVDDHRLMREGTAALLRADERVEVAGLARDGREALALAQRRAPDVVLLDLDMPELGGLETYAALRERHPDIEVLILTVSERDAMRGAIRGLAGDVLHEGTVQVMLEQYEKALATEGREARLQRLGSSLSSQPSAAEGAFALAAAVALADDVVTDEERSLVGQIREWFGITTERASVILHQLDDDKS